MIDGSKLTPLSGKARRKNFLVVDIESKDGFSSKAGFTRPFMVGVYDGTGYYVFFDKEPCTEENWRDHYYREGGCVDRALRFILQRKYRGWHIYAHNAGRFDYLFFMPWLMQVATKLGYHFSVIPVASSIQVLDVWETTAKHTRYRFLDSLKLIPTSLDKAAKSFGMGCKQKASLGELGLDTPEEDRKAWIGYNKPDCVILYRVLERFHHYVENVLLGEVGITAPSTSMKIFRRRFLKDAIPRAQETHEFIRKSYKGGRTEPFVRHGKKLRYFDINSSYPAAMLEDMPAGDAVQWEGEPPKRIVGDWRRDIEERRQAAGGRQSVRLRPAACRPSYIGFVEARVEVPDMNLPPLPVALDSDQVAAMKKRGQSVQAPGKLIFPVGRLEGIWEWSELQMALEVGCKLVEWKKSVWYPARPLFREYVEELYQYRDKTSDKYDEGLAEVVKIMLNSLYGKFGMKTLRKQIYLWNDPELPDNAVPANGDPDCPVWYAETESDAPYVMPQISARVTSLARQRLYRGMLEIERGGGTVYYVDTDSIITDGTMKTSTKLGDFKDELPEISGKIVGDFIAPKLYMLSAETGFSKVKAKGIESKMKTVEMFRKLAAGERIIMNRLEKVGTLAREGFSRGPLMRQVPRRFLAEDAKRVIHKDGTSSPIQLVMW